MTLKFDTELEGELTHAFQKWHEEFGKLSQDHWKVSKLRLWWDPMIQSGKCMSLKFTAELCVMTKKKDVKSEQELTCQIKIDMRKLWLEHSKVSKVCILMGLVLTKVYNFWPKKVQRSYLSWHWRVMQNLKRNWHAAFKINIRNLVNFDSSTQNSHKFAL